MNYLPETIWGKRWQALEELLADRQHSYSRLAQKHDVLKTLAVLIDCLHNFGASQFKFFYDGFFNDRLLPSVDYPAEYVLRATLDQIAFDMAVIQRAVAQRQESDLRPTLTKADQFAQHALKLAIDNGLLPTCTTVTYFNKSYNVRLIPYAPVALIGIPYSCTELKTDYLAIPHEVGHYVYHHAAGLAALLHDLIVMEPDWVNHWVEEIFADVYGCLVAGPVLGLSFQDILLDNSQAKFVADDGAHPIDAIRPYIYSKTLAEMGFNKAAQALNERWEKMLAKRHKPTRFMPFRSNAPATLADARSLVEETAVSFCHFLTKDKQVQPKDLWSNDTADLDSLYAAFVTRTDKPIDVELAQLVDLDEEVGLIVNGNSNPKNKRGKGQTQTWRDSLKELFHNSEGLVLPALAWTPIFTAGYWPSKGPEGNSDGGI